ncbi:hypothetical protein KL928_003381 [Ogataea angusta]|uniref:Uncharacterized protein n=1 Tax=Pichia angusta TaxID=870730 RepID=A0AAN6I5Q2_PICAN|nr:uncharacterized protein KL928_003381 [Ogataea angusta]KAG7818380.1 hypothetical protein KL928_003381 [Ogataea angusta]
MWALGDLPEPPGTKSILSNLHLGHHLLPCSLPTTRLLIELHPNRGTEVCFARMLRRGVIGRAQLGISSWLLVVDQILKVPSCQLLKWKKTRISVKNLIKPSMHAAFRTPKIFAVWGKHNRFIVVLKRF